MQQIWGHLILISKYIFSYATSSLGMAMRMRQMRNEVDNAQTCVKMCEYMRIGIIWPSLVWNWLYHQRDSFSPGLRFPDKKGWVEVNKVPFLAVCGQQAGECSHLKLGVKFMGRRPRPGFYNFPPIFPSFMVNWPPEWIPHNSVSREPVERICPIVFSLESNND